MGRLLFAIFLLVPMIEIGIFIIAGQAVGLWPTLGGVVLTALIGSFIIRLQGVSLFQEIRTLTGQGALPARQIADGVMLAIAGALLLTPGYFTDMTGFLLLVPPLRRVIYQALKSKVAVSSGFVQGERHTSGDPSRTDFDADLQRDTIVDLDQNSWRQEPD